MEWSVECKVLSVSVKRKVWSGLCGVQIANCGVWSVKYRVWGVGCQVQSVECKVQSVECTACGLGV